jgi:hypothetical protein
MIKWKRLDLRSKADTPATGALTVFRMQHRIDQSVRYDVGHLETDGRKTWLRSTRGTEDPARLKRRYDIWWCPVPEFDGK